MSIACNSWHPVARTFLLVFVSVIFRRIPWAVCEPALLEKLDVMAIGFWALACVKWKE